MSDKCNDETLIKLGGSLHPDGKTYYCRECGDYFRVEKAPPISVTFGAIPASEREGEK